MSALQDVLLSVLREHGLVDVDDDALTCKCGWDSPNWRSVTEHTEHVASVLADAIGAEPCTDWREFELYRLRGLESGEGE